MEFIVLGKFRKKPTKATPAEADKWMAKMKKEGVEFANMYWTLGRYDTVAIVKAKDEKTAMKALLGMGEIMATETLVAVPRAIAIKWLD